MAKTTGKISYLDGIRGVAAFFVFFHHFLLAFYSAYYTFDVNATNNGGLDVRYGKSILSVLSNGNFCVCIFFVLSGYVLSRKYFIENRAGLLVSAAQRRFIRLYIPVATTIIVAFLMMKTHLFYNVPVSRITHSEWWLGSMWTFPDPFTQLLHSLKVGTMFQGDSSFDTSLWTMTIELIGSMFVFAFLALTHNTRNRLISLLLIFVYCKATDQLILSCFIFGISLNYTEQYFRGRSKYLAGSIAFVLMVMALYFGSFPTTGVVQGTAYEHFLPSLSSYGYLLHTVGAYFLVLAFVLSPVLQRIAGLRLFRFLGYISFSFYLLHPLIIGSFSCYLFLHYYPQVSYNHLVPVIFVLTAIVCIIISWFMTKFIDTPGMNFSKYVFNRWFKKSPVAEVPKLQPAESE